MFYAVFEGIASFCKTGALQNLVNDWAGLVLEGACLRGVYSCDITVYILSTIEGKLILVLFKAYFQFLANHLSTIKG